MDRAVAKEIQRHRALVATLCRRHRAQQALQRIERFVARKDFAVYQSDELLRSAVERPFEILGEALNQL